MPPGKQPNPFAKVTEETSETEHERRLIRGRVAAERKKAAKKADVARKAKTVDKTVPADAPTPPAPSAASSSSSKPTPKVKALPRAKPIAPGRGTPLRKKRSGLRGVALTFTHYGVKKVTRRPSALQSVKVPRVPPLPGQEDVPLTDSEDEDAAGWVSDAETDKAGGDAGDGEGESSAPDDDDAADEPGTWEQGSQTSTVIEALSDREDFDAEPDAEPDAELDASTEQVGGADVPPLPPQRSVESNTAGSNVNSQVAAPLGFGPATLNASAQCPPSIIAPPLPAGNATSEQPLAEHPFGPALNSQTMATGYFSPDQAVMMNMPFPNNPGPADSYFDGSQGTAGWAWNADFMGNNNMLGVNAAPAPDFAFGMGAGFDQSDHFGPQGPSFLEQLASDGLPEPEPAAFADPRCSPGSAPASHLTGTDTRRVAPLPKPRVTDTTPSTPRVSSSHFAPTPQAATPTGSSFHHLTNAHTRAFNRSFSAPFETPVRRLSLQLKDGHARTRPGTPIAALPRAGPGGNVCETAHSAFARNSPSLARAPSPLVPQDEDTGMQDVFGADEPTLPFSHDSDSDTHAMVPVPRPSRAMQGIPIVRAAGEPEDRDFVIDHSSLPQHTRKKIRLIPPRSHAPTMKEIRKNKEREYASIKKRRKSATPKAGASAPRVGTHMGSFSHQHQEYMFIFRSSLSADVVMIAPWAEPEAEMVKRAIDRSDAATGLRKDDVVKGEFEATAMRGLSSCRSQFADPVLRLVKTRFKDVNKANAQALLAGDLFMYKSDAKLPCEFGDTVIMRDVATELFFSHGLNLGGLFMEDMLREDSLEVRRKLLTHGAAAAHEPVPASFDYTDMSDDALRGPPLASLAFAGIAIQHALKKIEGTAGKFEEATYGESWGRYVNLLASHPCLGSIRSKIFEEIKLRYSSVYCQGHRDSGFSEQRAWEWR